MPLDDAEPTLAEVLSEHGYVTAGFVANFFNADYEHGLDRGFPAGLDLQRLAQAGVVGDALGLEPVGASLAHRVAGRGEWQFGDEHPFAEFTGQIQPFTERLQAEQDGDFARLHPLGMALEKLENNVLFTRARNVFNSHFFSRLQQL